MILKKFSWLSYWSLILSIFPIPFFFVLLYELTSINGYFGLFLIALSIILSLVFGIMALFRKTEKNILAVLSISFALLSAGVMGIILMLGQMGNLPNA